MKNYERYSKTTIEEYDRKTIMSYLCRAPSNRKIIPLILQIKNKKILDVGLGTGSYSRILMSSNSVTGVDMNPHLCKLPIKLYKGNATELSNLVDGEKFDVVFSTWMTEYLNEEQLTAFFVESKKVLKNDGQLITTIISRYGLGFIYITLAKKLRNIRKYNYSPWEIVEKLRLAGFTEVEILKVNSWLCFPWAYLVIAG